MSVHLQQPAGWMASPTATTGSGWASLVAAQKQASLVRTCSTFLWRPGGEDPPRSPGSTQGSSKLSAGCRTERSWRECRTTRQGWAEGNLSISGLKPRGSSRRWSGWGYREGTVPGVQHPGKDSYRGNGESLPPPGGYWVGGETPVNGGSSWWPCSWRRTDFN